MTVSPTSAEPPIPPNKPVRKLAMPWTEHSWIASKDEGGSFNREFTTVWKEVDRGRREEGGRVREQGG